MAATLSKCRPSPSSCCRPCTPLAAPQGNPRLPGSSQSPLRAVPVVPSRLENPADYANVILAALSYTKGNRSLDDSVAQGADLGRAWTRSLNSEQLNITSQGVFIYARTSVSNNGTINWSTMGPTLMSCDLMNNSKTALLHSSPL